MDASVAFGKVLNQLRKKAGLTQEELGFEAGLRRTYISILELGQQQPSLATILKLAKALNLHPHQIVRMLEKELAQSNLGSATEPFQSDATRQGKKHQR